MGLETDEFGVLMALSQYAAQGGCCDEIPDDSIFTEKIIELQAVMETAVDECFGGDWSTFTTMLLTAIALGQFSGKEPLSAAQEWLEDLWMKSAALYN